MLLIENLYELVLIQASVCNFMRVPEWYQMVLPNGNTDWYWMVPNGDTEGFHGQNGKLTCSLLRICMNWYWFKLRSVTSWGSLNGTKWYYPMVIPTGTEWYQMVILNCTQRYYQMILPNGTEWCLMVPNGTKWYQMVPNGTECYCMVPNCIEWYRMVRNWTELYRTVVLNATTDWYYRLEMPTGSTHWYY